MGKYKSVSTGSLIIWGHNQNVLRTLLKIINIKNLFIVTDPPVAHLPVHVLNSNILVWT